MSTIQTIADLISLWPSAAALAAAMDEKPTTVRMWAARDSIPADRWLTLVEVSQKQGVEGINLYLLARIAARRKCGRYAA
ncbi:carph-isopro domain-containing protein [Phaeospirillum tilakii]|uniref:Carph-isopro domain-containing protein n=1 Tax=Phaeospirillum tilakii TaxID=741673 RepID=A0ABW5CD33_9PROT